MQTATYAELQEAFKTFGFRQNSTFAVFCGAQDVLNNSYPGSNITYNRLTADNVDALFQAQKYDGTTYYGKFNGISAHEASQLNKSLRSQKVDICKNWETIRLRVMTDLLQLKFSSHNQKKILMATGDKHLVFHNISGEEKYWSDGYDGTGLNMLGKCLMSLRDFLGGPHLRCSMNAPKEYHDWIKRVQHPVPAKNYQNKNSSVLPRNNKPVSKCNICWGRVALNGFDICDICANRCVVCKDVAKARGSAYCSNTCYNLMALKSAPTCTTCHLNAPTTGFSTCAACHNIAVNARNHRR